MYYNLFLGSVARIIDLMVEKCSTGASLTFQNTGFKVCFKQSFPFYLPKLFMSTKNNNSRLVRPTLVCAI